jgi:hypothetical protein
MLCAAAGVAIFAPRESAAATAGAVAERVRKRRRSMAECYRIGAVATIAINMHSPRPAGCYLERHDTEFWKPP